MIDYILKNDDFKKKIVAKQNMRLEQLKPEVLKEEMKKYLTKILGEL